MLCYVYAEGVRDVFELRLIRGSEDEEDEGGQGVRLGGMMTTMKLVAVHVWWILGEWGI